ncbi:hypothetical protein GCM10011391_05970 [Pullulanibacillus camelliae]|uniref:Uncharacterized protein n=1 Tax=Pullulanibacillus camelliae TaxID=1707096 RepID=A0A8J2VGC2_9BACL|nr:hypothetical protein GCM10011391_05970 [Pullulanibacillus camelliae]
MLSLLKIKAPSYEKPFPPPLSIKRVHVLYEKMQGEPIGKTTRYDYEKASGEDFL